jgi:hypothetical protein
MQQERRYNIRLQTQTEAWMQQFDSYITHACSFTFQQAVGETAMTAERAWLYWDNYCKYLNRVIYGHAAKRHSKSLLILPVLHGEISGKRLHMHAGIGCIDRDYSYSKLATVINTTWRDMRWTLNEIDIQPYRTSGWIGYMLHESVRLDLHSVDVTRCCIPPTLQADILS